MTLRKRIRDAHPIWIFWGSFLLLNGLLFLPIYLFFQEDTSFWPGERPFAQGFWQRENLDIFRLNLELLVVAGTAVFIPALRRRWFVVLATVLYLWQFSYAIYEGFVRSYYLLDPTAYNDFFLFADGGRYLFSSLSMISGQYLIIGLLILLVVGLLWRLNGLLFSSAAELNKVGRGLLLALLGAAVWPVVQLGADVGLPETAVSSFTAKISHNIQLSRAAKAEADRFDSQYLAPFYQFTRADLAQKPDIYLIFLESYGTVLYKRSDFQKVYLPLLGELEEQLAADGWSAASSRSEAPTWGGGSWISYTSAISGLRLDNHAQYLAMFNRYSREPFPHLFNYLRGQGYRSYRLSPNSDQLNDIEWQRYKNFYGVDEWLRFYDLQYGGPLFGWGPSPPDQYALNFAYEYMNQDTAVPHVFFYITQNSHYPWTPLPEVTDDWQSLNDAPPVPPPPTQRLPIAEMRQQYLASIQYELRMVIDFITTTADENDLFIILGDHQPARVARYTDGWDTPLHIISQNKAFVESFEQFGFVPGLATRSQDVTVHHEGLYSLLMRALLGQYGMSPNDLPAYQPDGIPLD